MADEIQLLRKFLHRSLIVFSSQPRSSHHVHSDCHSININRMCNARHIDYVVISLLSSDLQIHPTSPDGNALIAYDPKQHNSSKYWISNIESFLKAAHGQCKMARSKRLGLSHASQYRFDRRMLNARNEIITHNTPQ
uniref:Uncharacterized protein n=2 Tax=Timema TaxID=61471 RepID=A0A7R9AQV6_TIMSH|nr:unnamed protein product [Timema shepardi]CAD7569412.1 unnamed protein product [Timema californicum]